MIQDYVRKLGPGIKLNFVELKDEKLGKQSDAEAKKKEKERLFEKWPTRTTVVALDQTGKSMDSPAFAKTISRVRDNGLDLAFIIGGPVGLDPEVLKKADKVISLSPMTFPHRLVRLILIEQVYRAFTILRNEPYHK